MIVDVDGTILTPGNLGIDCQENGGEQCCCDECDYLLCCTDENYQICCKDCCDWDCPRKELEKPL